MTRLKNIIQSRVPDVLSLLVYGLLSLISTLSRHRHIGRDLHPLIKAKKHTCILAFWHSRILVPVYFYRWSGIGALVSPSKDGEYFTRLAERCGYVITRGSGSRRGVGGLKGLLQALKTGRTVIVTPDGPRGPRETVQMGVIQLAKLSGMPVTPVSFSCSRNIRLKSWDRFMIPLPFGTLYTVVGEDLFVDRNDDAETMEQKRRLLEEEMRRVTRLADERSGTAPVPMEIATVEIRTAGTDAEETAPKSP